MYRLNNPDEYALIRLGIYGARGKIDEVDVWMQLGTDDNGRPVAVNMNGGYQPLGNSEVLQTVCLEDWQTTFALDQTVTTAYKRLAANLDNPELTAGWITPDGRFLRCEYYQHDALAEVYIGKHVRDVEQDHIRVGQRFLPHLPEDSKLWDKMTKAQSEMLTKVLDMRDAYRGVSRKEK